MPTEGVEVVAAVGDEVHVEGFGLLTVLAVTGGEVLLALSAPEAVWEAG